MRTFRLRRIKLVGSRGLMRTVSFMAGLRILLLLMAARSLLVRRGLHWVGTGKGRGCRMMILRWFRGALCRVGLGRSRILLDWIELDYGETRVSGPLWITYSKY